MLSRRTPRASTVFQGVAVTFTLLSCVPNLVNESEFGEGFAAASIPLHLIAGIVAIIVIPFVVKRQANHSAIFHRTRD